MQITIRLDLSGCAPVCSTERSENGAQPKVADMLPTIGAQYLAQVAAFAKAAAAQNGALAGAVVDVE